MDFLLTAIGSYGDIHPLVGLGKTLLARGHSVSMIVNPHFNPILKSSGIQAISIGTAEEYELLSNNPNIWHPIRGPILVLKEALAGLSEALYNLVSQNIVPGKTVIVAHGLDVGSRILQEATGQKVASIALAPMQIRSNIAPPKIWGYVGRSWPFLWHKRLQHWIMDRIVLDPLLRKPIERTRKAAGLKRPVKRYLNKWWYSPDLVLCLFPEWFAPPQKDWPVNSVLTNFPLWDESEQSDMPQEVEDFLQAGEPPIVFSPGSAMKYGHRFFEAAIESCKALGKRGMLLTKYPEQLPSDLPSDVQCFPYVPFSLVLPHAAAFVHHGGIGSSSQGLSAGVPQLVCPWSFDQPDNAERLKQLGVGQTLPQRRLASKQMIPILDYLCHDSDISSSCKTIAEKCKQQNGLQLACDALEQLRNEP